MQRGSLPIIWLLVLVAVAIAGFLLFQNTKKETSQTKTEGYLEEKYENPFEESGYQNPFSEETYSNPFESF